MISFNLNISYNKIGDIGIKYFSNGLKKLEFIKTLDLKI